MAVRLNRANALGRLVWDGAVGSSPRGLGGPVISPTITIDRGTASGEQVFQDTTSLNGQALYASETTSELYQLMENGGATIFARAHVVSLTGGGNDYIYRFASDSGDNILIAYNSFALTAYSFQETSQGAIDAIPSVTWGAGKTYSFFMRMTAGATDFTADVYDHALGVWSQATENSTTVTSDFKYWRYMKLGDTSSRDSRLSLFLMFRDRLSDAAMYSLAYNPWQVFEGPTQTIITSTAAATAAAGVIPRDVPWTRKPPG